MSVNEFHLIVDVIAHCVDDVNFFEHARFQFIQTSIDVLRHTCDDHENLPDTQNIGDAWTHIVGLHWRPMGSEGKDCQRDKDG